MEINEILIGWGINIQNNDDFFEYFTSTKPQHCYYIDRFPLLIESFKKYQQVELYYEQVLNKEIPKKFFVIEESKFVRVMKKLWLYNEVVVQTDLLEVPNDKIINILGKNNSTIMELRNIVKSSKNDTMFLENVKHLDLLVKLAVRETVYSKMFFLDQKIIIIVYSTCFQVYLHDLSSLEVLKTIVSTEGLYLRPYIFQ